MKNLIATITVLVASQIAMAGQGRMNTCLPYDLPEEKGVKIVHSMEIKETSELTSLQAKQVWALANHWAQVADYDGGYNSLKHAIRVLRADSEMQDDLAWQVFKYKGEAYNRVVFYPGGNPVGLIFKNGRLFAEQSDGDITCK